MRSHGGDDASTPMSRLIKQAGESDTKQAAMTKVGAVDANVLAESLRE